MTQFFTGDCEDCNKHTLLAPASKDDPRMICAECALERAREKELARLLTEPHSER